MTRLPHVVFGLLLSACVVFLFTGVDALRLAAGVIAVTLMAVQTVRRPDARIAFGLLTIANAAWAIGRDRHIVGDGAYGGPKTLHLLGSARDGAADAVEKALRGRTGPARRIVLWERDPAFRWHGTARIDLAVHAWADTPEAAAECGRELDALLSTVDGLGHVVSLRAEEIVLRPVTG